MSRALPRFLITIGVLVIAVGPARAFAADPLDPSFGTGGTVFPGPRSTSVNGLASDGLGRIVGVGGIGLTVWRSLADGDLDQTFADAGVAQPGLGEGKAALVEPDGRLLVGGEYTEGRGLLTRLNEDGSLDPAFGDAGRIALRLGRRGAIESIARMPSGRILAAGWGHDYSHHWRAVVAAYHPDGTLDRSYARGNGHDGIAEYTTLGRNKIEFDAIKLLPGGATLVAGDVGGRVLLVRLRADGIPNERFGSEGIRYYDIDGNPLCFCSETQGLALDSRGRAIVSADVVSSDGKGVAVMRLLPDGRRDRSFGRGGVVRTFLGSRLGAEDIVVQKNGKILIAGYYNVPKSGEARIAAVRYLADGRLDPSFGHGGIFTRDLGVEGVALAALALPEGRVVLAGRIHRREERTLAWFESQEPFLMRLRP